MITPPLPALQIKRGDAFRRACAVVDIADDGTETAVPIGDWAIAAQVRDSAGELVADLAVSSRNDAAGTFVLDAETATWPVGRLYVDVQYTVAGLVRSTRTVELTIVRDMTQ